MAAKFTNPKKGLSSADKDVPISELEKEGIWYIKWGENSDEDKKNIIGVSVNYYIKNTTTNGTEYYKLDHCGGAIYLDGKAFTDIRKPVSDDTSSNIVAKLLLLANDGYKDNETFNFSVWYEPAQFTYNAE